MDERDIRKECDPTNLSGFIKLGRRDGTLVAGVSAGSADPAREPVHLMPVEVANILCRAEHRGDVSADSVALAHADLMALPVELFPYAGAAERVWELRRSVTCHNAWTVALAERLDAPLGTLTKSWRPPPARAACS